MDTKAVLKAVRGTRDLLPPETEMWNRVEAVARGVFARYGFGEIRTPVFEDTGLFARGVGEETDIVSKEMYTWEDGERFDKKSLSDRWISKRDEPRGSISPCVTYDLFDLEMFPESGPVQFVAFSQRRTPELESEIAAFSQPEFPMSEDIEAWLSADSPESPLPQRRLKSIKRLVVASPVPNKEDEWIAPDFVIEYVSGNFTKSSQSLTLRPENTAGVVRAYIEHKMGDAGGLQKLFYIGPQFRRERPQRGRYRQFWQIGAEVIGPASSGAESPVRDAEVLEMLATLLDELGIAGWTLAVNSVGSATDRPRYVAALRKALGPIKDRLSADNQRRAETNPLRVLDSKEPGDQELIDGLPKIADFLDEASTAHFRQVLEGLDACGVPYVVNPRLVRGLDYYTRTTFEFTHSVGLGSQNALLGGGRYDGLSEMLGGPRAPGIGFAIGEDRLILTLQAQAEAAVGVSKMDAYVAPMGVERNAAGLALARELRRAGLTVGLGDGGFRLKKSFEAGDAVARAIVLVGEDEVASGVYTVKTFATGEQGKVGREGLVEFLKAQR